MDFIHKKKWLNDHGTLRCHASYGVQDEAMVIWTSKNNTLSMTEEGDDVQDAVDHLFNNVKNKLFRMTRIIENRMT